MISNYLVDTHTHLYSDEFTNDIADVLARASEAGVKQLILPAIDSSTFDAMAALQQRFSKYCFPALGLHPTSVKESYLQELEFVKAHLESNPYIAIGEIGIDCYWSVEFIDQQRCAFRKQLAMAVESKLPVIIHSRQSLPEIFHILHEFEGAGLTGVFHSFSGTINDYEHIHRLGGFKIGVGGVLTFKNTDLPALVKEIPLEDIVLETDSPYLTPTPHRGKRNESSYLVLVAKKLAEIKGIDYVEAVSTTTQNARKIFKLPDVES